MRIWSICIMLGLLAGLGGGIVAVIDPAPAWIAIAAHALVGVAVAALAAMLLKTRFGSPLDHFAATLLKTYEDGDLSRRAATTSGPLAECIEHYNRLIASFQGIV
ncbi:MAG: chemotaxis protein, partial [Betaproteobacteria bacterium HGW-Betaproteobacteria-19]